MPYTSGFRPSSGSAHPPLPLEDGAGAEKKREVVEERVRSRVEEIQRKAEEEWKKEKEEKEKEEKAELARREQDRKAREEEWKKKSGEGGSGAVSATSREAILKKLEQKEMQKKAEAEVQLQSIVKDRVKINVGGRVFETVRSTLFRDSQSRLAKMFGYPPGDEVYTNPVPALEVDDSGMYFLDRDPDVFASVLQWCRSGQFEAPSTIPAAVLEADLMHYGCPPHLVDAAQWASKAKKAAEMTTNKIRENVLFLSRELLERKARRGVRRATLCFISRPFKLDTKEEAKVKEFESLFDSTVIEVGDEEGDVVTATAGNDLLLAVVEHLRQNGVECEAEYCKGNLYDTLIPRYLLLRLTLGIEASYRCPSPARIDVYTAEEKWIRSGLTVPPKHHPRHSFSHHH
uniref:BTB domain-containing protein n=1 Tax=Palpitomonas bilix TaxID=652834 RepID=A0A7S3GKZ7_9EUKA|mmetsp:Transcript_7892/g.20542  ORF Transcript_7892/g.20542 Transcript_7892/m.20542 type:complete len:402 (+) Transcript_7892:211-1416(+)